MYEMVDPKGWFCLEKNGEDYHWPIVAWRRKKGKIQCVAMVWGELQKIHKPHDFSYNLEKWEKSLTMDIKE